MDRQIRPTIKYGGLDFASEHPEAAHVSQSLGLNTVTCGGDVDQFDCDRGSSPAKQVGDMVRLPQCQITGSGGDPNSLQH
jgi:hypothetical protein